MLLLLDVCGIFGICNFMSPLCHNNEYCKGKEKSEWASVNTKEMEIIMKEEKEEFLPRSFIVLRGLWRETKKGRKDRKTVERGVDD
jgi:hypothetical protein